MIVQLGLITLIRLCAQIQRPVVNIAGATEGLYQPLFLLRGWIEPVAIRALGGHYSLLRHMQELLMKSISPVSCIVERSFCMVLAYTSPPFSKRDIVALLACARSARSRTPQSIVARAILHCLGVIERTLYHQGYFLYVLFDQVALIFFVRKVHFEVPVTSHQAVVVRH